MTTASPVDCLKRLVSDLDALAAADYNEIAKFKIRDEHQGVEPPESVTVFYRLWNYPNSSAWDELQDALSLVPRAANQKLKAYLKDIATALECPRMYWQDATYLEIVGAPRPRLFGAVPTSGRISKPDSPPTPITNEERFLAVQEQAYDGWLRAQSPIKRASKYVTGMLESVTAKIYTEPRTPDEWAKVFDASWKTIRRRIDAGELRAIEVHSKAWRIHLADLPTAAPRKQKVDKSRHAAK